MGLLQVMICQLALLTDQAYPDAPQFTLLPSCWSCVVEPGVCDHTAVCTSQVKLPGGPRSCFWRFHTEGVSDEGVCTIEALHLLLRAWAGGGSFGHSSCGYV